jgi:23S rRNA (cytidine1920-2'-O)/16S rRNA (cytidine1409-2'-O)-methyltransferase
LILGKTRLDQHLVNLSLFESRTRAAAAIKAGLVRVNGETALKAATGVSQNDRIEAEAEHAFVSRGGMKLEKALAHFGYSVSDGIFADIGASTGGFSDVLLRSGAAFIYAIDVGHDQLHASLQGDARVQNMAGVNVRHITAAHFDRPLLGLVCDVSFINQEKALAAMLPLMPIDAWAIALIKPQFEVGKAALGKNGVVSDAALRRQVCDTLTAWWQAQGWCVDGVTESPITGPQGNIEYLLGARKTLECAMKKPAAS